MAIIGGHLAFNEEAPRVLTGWCFFSFSSGLDALVLGSVLIEK